MNFLCSRRLLLPIFTSYFFTGPVFGHTDENDFFTLSLDELVEVEIFTASQETETAAESAAVISVITAQQIKEWGITSLHDVVSLLPGIVKGETYLGQTTQTIRGVNPGLFNNKSLYMINGHPSYESLFGSTLLDYVPIEIVERIEVVRSPASVLYGTNAISGVINIITKQGTGNENAVTVRAGSNSHQYGSLVHHSEHLSMAASVQRDDGYNYSGATDEFGNEVDLDYQYDVENLFIDGHGNDWRINAAIFDREKALYGINPWVWHNGVFETYVGYVDANKTFQFDTAELNMWLRYDVSDKDIQVGGFPYPADLSECRAFNIPTSPADPCVLANPLNRTDTASTVINNVERTSFELQYKDVLNDELSYIVGATVEEQKSDPLLFIYDSDGTLNRPAFAEKQDTSTTAAYAQLKYQHSDDTIFILGVRGEDNSEAGSSGLMPRVGVTHQVVDKTYLKLLYSEAFRTPMFIEKYVNLQNVLIGDELLERETIQSLEFALESQLNNNNHLQVALYTLSLEDEILRFPSLTGPAAEYRNGEGKDMQGVEVELRSVLSKDLELLVNAGFVDGEDKSLGVNDAPMIANEALNAIITYHISKKWTVSMTGQYIGEKETVLASTGQRGVINSYQLFNLSSVYRTGPHEVSLILKNLTDEEYTYPEPVRRLIDDVPGGPDFTAYAQYQFHY